MEVCHLEVLLQYTKRDINTLILLLLLYKRIRFVIMSITLLVLYFSDILMYFLTGHHVIVTVCYLIGR